MGPGIYPLSPVQWTTWDPSSTLLTDTGMCVPHPSITGVFYRIYRFKDGRSPGYACGSPQTPYLFHSIPGNAVQCSSVGTSTSSVWSPTDYTDSQTTTQTQTATTTGATTMCPRFIAFSEADLARWAAAGEPHTYEGFMIPTNIVTEAGFYDHYLVYKFVDRATGREMYKTAYPGLYEQRLASMPDYVVWWEAVNDPCAPVEQSSCDANLQACESARTQLVNELADLRSGVDGQVGENANSAQGDAARVQAIAGLRSQLASLQTLLDQCNGNLAQCRSDLSATAQKLETCMANMAAATAGTPVLYEDVTALLDRLRRELGDLGAAVIEQGFITMGTPIVQGIRETVGQIQAVVAAHPNVRDLAGIMATMLSYLEEYGRAIEAARVAGGNAGDVGRQLTECRTQLAEAQGDVTTLREDLEACLQREQELIAAMEGTVGLEPDAVAIGEREEWDKERYSLERLITRLRLALKRCQAKAIPARGRRRTTGRRRGLDMDAIYFGLLTVVGGTTALAIGVQNARARRGG